MRHLIKKFSKFISESNESNWEYSYDQIKELLEDFTDEGNDIQLYSICTNSLFDPPKNRYLNTFSTKGIKNKYYIRMFYYFYENEVSDRIDDTMDEIIHKLEGCGYKIRNIMRNKRKSIIHNQTNFYRTAGIGSTQIAGTQTKYYLSIDIYPKDINDLMDHISGPDLNQKANDIISSSRPYIGPGMQ